MRHSLRADDGSIRAVAGFVRCSKGLPDSSEPIRQDGLQGQVLAITIQRWILVSHLYLNVYLISRNVAALRGLAQQMRTVAAELS
jgi:hypothetical protein